MKKKSLAKATMVFLAILSLVPLVPLQARPTSFSLIIWYTLPPTVNYNPLAPQSITSALGIANPIAPLFGFHPYKELFFPVLGKDIKVNAEKGYLEVTLWPDNYWWDGENLSPFTAKDVWTYYTIQWKIFRNFIPWLLDIKIIDDYTVRFYFNGTEFKLKATAVDDPSKEFEYSFKSKLYYQGFFQLLTWGVSTPYKIFGSCAEMVADIPVGEVTKRFNITDLQNEVYGVQMDKAWANGPFWPDPTTLTTTGIKLLKNPGYRWSRYIKYDECEMLFARAEEQMVAWQMEGRDLLTWHGCSPMSMIEVDKTEGGCKIPYAWSFEIWGLWINIARYPFNITKVRQALTMLVDAQEAGNAFPPQMNLIFDDYITGLRTSEYLPEEVRNNLYDWSHDPERAYQLLEEAGFTRKGGQWYRPDGQPFTVEVFTVSAWADFVALATNIQSQLEQHGIKADVRSVDVGVYYSLWQSWDFDVSITYGGMVASQYAPSTDYTAFLNLYWIAWDFEVSKYNQTWPVPLKNGSTIYVNPYFEQMRLQAFMPGTTEWYDALSKLVWFWNYYLPAPSMWFVRRPYQLSVTQSNYAELLGKPTDTVKVLDYPLPYYGPDQSWLLTSHWGLYAPIQWMSYGILHPPDKPMSWPPNTPPKDVLKLLPPEVKVISIESLVTSTPPEEEEVPEEVSTEIAQLESRIEELNATMLDMRSRIDDLESQMATQIEALTDKVSDLELQLSDAAAAASGMQSIAYASTGIAVISLVIAILAIVRSKRK